MRRLAFLLVYIGLTAGVKFSIRSANLVKEHGVEYEQLLSYDPESDILKVEVPPHLDVLGSTTIFDKRQNLQIVYVPAHEYCKIEDFEDDFDPAQMMRTSIDYQLNKEVFRPEAARDVYRVDMNTPLRDHEINQLPDYIQEFCKGKKMNRVQSLRVSKEDFYNSTAMFLFPNRRNQQQQSRRKRQSPFLPLCGDSATLCTRKPDWGYRCLWKLVRTEGATVQELDHVRDMNLSCVQCCIDSGGKKYSQMTGMCKCELITNREEFMGCYPNDGDRFRTT